MRFYTTLTLVLVLALSLTLGCKKKSAPESTSGSSDQVAEGDANATGGSADPASAGAGMGGAGMDEGMDEGMDDDLTAGFEEGMELDEEGMDEEDLTAGFDGTADLGDDATGGDLASQFAGDGTDDGTGDGTTDPANFGAGGGRAAPRKPATLLDASKQAFAQRKNREGFDYAFAAVLLDKKVAPELLAQYEWVPGLGRPVLGVRWGIGVQFIGSPDAAKNPYPIGKEQKLPEKGSSRNRNRGGDDDLGDPGDIGGGAPGFGDDDLGGGFPGSGSGQGGNSELQKYTGDLGNKVIQRLQGRIERGYYGEVLKVALAGGGSSAGQGNQGGGFGPGGVGPGGFDPANEGLDDGLDPGDEGLDGAGFAGPGTGGFSGSGGRRGANQGVLP
ncbi:MAG: hypothetical protein VB877_15330, partial [Pirellulaceae bacterium]